ncbi:MAG: family 10 glycosylhydrolase [Candidatus Omnitrophica bacterium]|nr:family 10 glycosylhydrolase [Candidatus Omnitrophota bacterium]
MRIIKLSIVFLLIAAFLAPCLCLAQGAGEPKMGVWVSVFSKNKILYSIKEIDNLISFCAKNNISEIYLQLYQSGRAYYDSNILPRAKFDEIKSEAGQDPIAYLIKKAKAVDIKVFAWVNMLSVGNNRDADILNKYGNSVLTRDQHLDYSLVKEKSDIDNYFQREEYLFLEPGDPRVSEYLVDVVGEIAAKYPDLNGFHLDYIRYPLPLPFSVGARFLRYGLAYGYGKANLERFARQDGLDPLSNLNNREKQLKWDSWRRQQVTNLVKSLSQAIRSKNPNFLVSAAVVASSDRAYSSAFQDWPYWLESAALDYVVLMNYSDDLQMTKEFTLAALGLAQGKKVYIGVGAFLFKDNPQGLADEFKLVSTLKPDGIVFFSYDDLSDKLMNFLAGVN